MRWSNSSQRARRDDAARRPASARRGLNTTTVAGDRRSRGSQMETGMFRVSKVVTAVIVAGTVLLGHAGQAAAQTPTTTSRSEEHTSELQSLTNLVCRLLLEKKKKK